MTGPMRPFTFELEGCGRMEERIIANKNNAGEEFSITRTMSFGYGWKIKIKRAIKAVGI